MKIIVPLFILVSLSCHRLERDEASERPVKQDTSNLPEKYVFADDREKIEIQTGNTSPDEVIEFAKTLIGTPYKYASVDPSQGFDCSGFITYVFNHFNISVPRSSVDFTNVKREIKLEEARPGDLILFTGTDSTVRETGHMGIITTADNNNYEFIHSSSGKANGVTISPLNDYYKGRFIKVIRIFRQNDVS